MSVAESCLVAEGVAYDADIACLDIFQDAFKGLLAFSLFRGLTVVNCGEVLAVLGYLNAELAWRILSITLLACEMSAIVW